MLLDEVAVGTRSIQGAALARAIVESLVDREAQLLVTTHYAELKALPTRDARCENASLGFDLEGLSPTYQLTPNTPGSSSALSVAERLGLPAELLQRAAGLLDPSAARLDRLLAQLDEDRRQVAQKREALELEHARVRRGRRELDEARAALEAERSALKQRAYDEAVAALRSARAELDRTRKRLRQAADESAVKQADRQLKRLGGIVAEQAPAPPSPPARLATDEELVPGRQVWVPRLGEQVRVLELAGRFVVVQAGSLPDAHRSR